jgi:hypothetical protein
MSEEAINLTADEAIAVIAPGEHVHTFRNPNGMLIGADWDRADLEEAVRKASVRTLTGGGARHMKHGLAIEVDDRWLFVETSEDALVEIESRKAPAQPTGPAQDSLK